MAKLTPQNRVHFQPITVSRLMDNVVEVAEGLSANDQVVNNPSAALLEGEWSAIRAQVTFIEQDRYLAPDVERMRQWALRAPAAWPAPLAAVLGDA